MAEGTGSSESFSIWFFVGVMMLAYGIVLLPFGAYEWFGHHEAATVLNNLHPTFWWGLLIFLFGLFYTLKYKPRSTTATPSLEKKHER